MIIQVAFFYLVYIAVPVGLVLAFLVIRSRRITLRILFGVLGLVHLVAGGILSSNVLLTRNHSVVDDAVVLESWDAVSDGHHNSNTDLIDYDGALYLIHQASPYHLGTDKARLVIRRSADDGRTWTPVTEIDGGELDIRDPKFLIVGDRLYLYVLMNVELNPEPFTTLYTWSDDGSTWAPLAETGHPEWLFWRASLRDGVYYMPAYYYRHGESILLASADGEAWLRHATIFSGSRNDETAVAILPDGTMIATARMEYSESVFGHVDGSTLIGKAAPPYETFEVLVEDRSNRLDGPRLFVWQGRVFAVARYQPRQDRPWARMGSAFTRKRTSLFEVREDGLLWLTDLPSAGDTSYPGLVFRGNQALISYYTSNIRRDFIWFTGLLSPSPIRIARIDLDAMVRLADAARRR
jgi:hypothetical protein